MWQHKMELRSLMDCLNRILHSCASISIISLVSPIIRSCRLYLVVIVKKKNGKNGKSKLNKKINAVKRCTHNSNKNCLNKLDKKWKMAMEVHKLEEETRLKDSGSNSHKVPPRRLVVVVVEEISVIINYLKSRLIYRLRE